jgi:hypothetical protein
VGKCIAVRIFLATSSVLMRGTGGAWPGVFGLGAPLSQIVAGVSTTCKVTAAAALRCLGW